MLARKPNSKAGPFACMNGYRIEGRTLAVRMITPILLPRGPSGSTPSQQFSLVKDF
jgi:hypothetical protein